MLLSGPQVHAATKTWNNPAGGDFNTAGNWTPSGVPVTADTGLFNIAQTGDVTLSANATPGSINFDLAADNSTTHNLTIGANGGNTLTFGNTGNLSVLGTLTGTGKTFTIAAPAILTPATATTAGSFTIQNNATDSSNTLVVSGGISSGTTNNTETLTLAGANVGLNTVSGNITNGTATTFAVTKSGAGSWILSGTGNSYNGATTIGAGTLSLSGSLTGGTAIINFGAFNESATGVIGAASSLTNVAGATTLLGANSYTGATTINGGTLDIGGGTATGSVNPASVLNLAGGRLNYTNTSGGTQAFAGTNVNAGGSLVSAVVGDTVNLGAITRAAGGTIDFGSTGAVITSTPNTASGILGGYATFGGVNFAVANGGGAITGLTTYDQILDVTGDANTAHNDNITTTVGQTQTAASTVNTLTISSASGTLALGTSPLTFTAGGAGGLLYSGGGNYTISGSGTGVVGAGSTGEAIFNVSNGGNLTISGQVGTNTATAASLTTGGRGTVTLTGNNVYTGQTSVGPGTLQFGAGGATTLGTGGTYAGAIANSGSLIFNTTSNQTLSGVISGSGSLTKNTTGTLTLSNAANTYTGITTVTGGGTISISNDANLGAAPASPVPNQLTLDNGTLNLTTNNVNLAANRGITLGVGGGTINANFNNITPSVGGIITGPGALNVFTSNASGRNLGLNGVNTFTGGLTVRDFAYASLGNASAAGTGTVTLGTAGSGSTPILGLNGFTISNTITVTAGGNRNILNNGNSTVSGPITLTGGAVNPTLNLGNLFTGNTLNITGGVTGTGNLSLGPGSTSTRSGVQINLSGATINNVGTITNAGGVSGGTYTISSVIGSNVTGLIANQTGTVIPLVVSGNNSGANFFGDTTVTSGTVNVQNANALANSVVNTNATAGSLTFTNTPAAQIGGLNGVGSATAGSFGNVALVNTGTGAGPLTLSIGNSNISNGLTIPNTLNPSYSGILSGAGSLIKNGTNTQTLNGANTYSGGTTVTGGILVTGAAGTLGTGNVTTAASTTLTLGNTASIASTGSLLFVTTTTSIVLNYTGTDTVALINETDGAKAPLTSGMYDSTALNMYFGGSIFSGSGTLTVAPEPSTWAMLVVGLFATAGVMRSRRRSV